MRFTLTFLLLAGLFVTLSTPSTRAQSVLGSVTLGSQSSGDIAINPLTDRVYVGGGIANLGLSVVDVSTPTMPSVVTTLPMSGVTVDPGTNRFYTSSGFGGQIRVFDGATNAQIALPFIGFCGGSFSIDKVAGKVYVTSQCGGGNDPLHVLDIASNSIAAGPLGSGGVIGFPAANEATGEIFVSHSGGTRVFGPGPGYAVIDNLTGSVIAVDSSVNLVYQRFNGNPDLQVLDGSSHAVVGTVTGAAADAGAWAIDSNLQRLYVSDSTAQVVRIYDLMTDSFLGNFSLGAGVVPQRIAVNETTSRLYVHGSTGGGQSSLFVVDGTPCPATSGQPNSAEARLQVNGAGAGNCNGPFNAFVTSGGTLTIEWSGPSNQAITLLAGPLNANNSSFPCVGSLDIGTPPAFADVLVLFDGTLPILPHLLFRLDGNGQAMQTFSVPFPPGPLGDLQGLIFQAPGASCPVVLTAAFSIAII